MKANIPKNDWLVKGISPEQLKKERDFCCLCENNPCDAKNYRKAKRFCKKCDPYNSEKSRFKKYEFLEKEIK